ncbi:unnamed protein product [Caenorhabditis nigoni]
MTNQRFPFHRLPDDLRLKVLETTEHLEIMAYSFLSKKASSIVKDLHLPISDVVITMKKQPQIEVKLGFIIIKFELNMDETDEKMTDLDGFPVSVNVSYRNHSIRGFRNILSTWTNQGKSVGEWIQHLCSINQPKHCYVASFHVREIELDIQTLRNIFPKLGNLNIIFCHTEANGHDVLSAKNILKVFLPHVKLINLERVSFQDHFSLQHIGMGNSKFLELRFPRNVRVDDFSTLNAKSIYLETTQMSLRDLNRFFKLWMKGSNPKLEELNIDWDTDILPDWNVLFKGLKAKPTRNSRKKKLTIKNCRGVCAEIRCEWFDDEFLNVEFTVSK